jgi:large subunit ribosomal protein L25
MQIEFKATRRNAQGTGASRRLRRAGQVPGIIYGGAGEVSLITMDHNELYHLLRKEAFHASVLSIDVEGARQIAVLRDVQWHPFKQQVLHLDFQRVAADEKMHLKVPLHFVGDDVSPAVKLGGCMISHVINELDVQCLPKDLPEFIEVDLSALEAGQSVHVSQIKLPAGVEVVHHGEGDPVIATALVVKGAAAEGEGEAA